MARGADPDSAGSQFFILHGDAPALDGKYTAFGKLVSGYDVLDRIGTCIETTAGVRSYHALRARRLGGRVAVDVHVLVDSGVSVHDGHEIAEHVRLRVLACGCDVLEVVVHVEPDEPEQQINP